MTPEMMGLPPDPAMFAALMNQQPGPGISDEELRRIAAGLPPGAGA